MLKKMITAMATVAAVSAVAVLPAMAAATDYTAKMYGKTTKNGVEGYLESSHTAKMIKSVSKRGENYTVVFQPITMGAVNGYISQMSTSNGYEGVLRGQNLTLTYVPAGDQFQVIDSEGKVLGTEEGTMIEYAIQMSVGVHSTQDGAIVVEPVEAE